MTLFSSLRCQMFYFIVQMIPGKARKRKWKETKLMNEYAKVHKKQQEVTENISSAEDSVHTGLYRCLLSNLNAKFSFVVLKHKIHVYFEGYSAL